VVNSVDPDYDEVCDSDGEVVGRERSTFAIFEFISVLSESSRLQRLLPPILPELVYYLIAHMQITEDQVIRNEESLCMCVFEVKVLIWY